MSEVRIESMRETDWEQVRTIYLEGIATGDATFEELAPSWDGWDSQHLFRCRLVAKRDDEVVGWAALAPVSSRAVYAGVAEVSVYVSSHWRDRGIGSKLLHELIAESEACGLWTLQAGIFQENVASIRLHEKCGFRIVGRRERLGKMAGRWRDVMLLERRSDVVGMA